jgi:hypothetical protein
MGDCASPSDAMRSPMTLRLVEPVAPYTSAMPYSRKPVEKAPRRKYLSDPSAARALRRLSPAST